jgi:hypothetical protein
VDALVEVDQLLDRVVDLVGARGASRKSDDRERYPCGDA